MFKGAIAAALLLSPTADSGQATTPPNVTLSGHQAEVLFVAFSADGKKLAAAADDGVVKVWDIASQKVVSSSGPDMLHNTNQVRFAPDGKSLATIGNSNQIVVLDTQTGKPLREFPITDMSGGPRGVDLSPDGKTLAVIGRGKLVLLNYTDGKIVAMYEVHKGYAGNAVTWSADGKTIATTGSDRIAMVLSAADGKVVKSWPIQSSSVSIAFGHDGKSVYVASDDRVLRVCELASDEPKAIIEKMVPIITLAMSHDGKTLVMGGSGKGPWLLTTASQTMSEPTLDAGEWIKSATISADGASLAGGGKSGAIYLWKTPK